MEMMEMMEILISLQHKKRRVKCLSKLANTKRFSIILHVVPRQCGTHTFSTPEKVLSQKWKRLVNIPHKRKLILQSTFRFPFINNKRKCLFFEAYISYHE